MDRMNPINCKWCHVAIGQPHVMQWCSAIGCYCCHVVGAAGATVVWLPLSCTCTHNIMNEKKKASMTYHCLVMPWLQISLDQLKAIK